MERWVENPSVPANGDFGGFDVRAEARTLHLLLVFLGTAEAVPFQSARDAGPFDSARDDRG